MEDYKGEGAMDKVSQKTLENQAAELSGRKGCISGSTLKIIALTVMLLDHAAVAILGRILIRQGYLRIMLNTDPAAYAAWQSENMCILVLYWAMRLIGRLGFPIFCFLLIEGVRHTQNKVKYALRLGCFALISEIPFDLAIRGEILEFSYQNVFFTLFLGMVALCAYDFLDSRVIPAYLQSVCLFGGIFVFGMYVTLFLHRNSQRLFGWYIGPRALIRVMMVVFCIIAFLLGVYAYKLGLELARSLAADLGVMGGMMFAADLLKTDYAALGILTISVMYFFRKKPVRSMLAGNIVLTLGELSEFTSFGALVPIALYNGKRGLKMKYFFYIFYPAHLLILYLAAAAMGMGDIPGI